MPLDIACPSCGAKYRVKDTLAGRTAKCTKCGSSINIPQSAAVEDDTADDEYKLAAAEPRSDSTSSAEQHPGVDREGGEKCPICSASLSPDAGMCMSCGFEFKEETGSDDVTAEDSESGPDKLSEREEELIAEIPVSTATRVSTSVAPYVMIAVALAMIVVLGWWAYGVFARWQSHGRIDSLVASAMEGKSAPELAAELAADIPRLPNYLAPLFSQAKNSKQNNFDIQGLKFFEENPYPHYQVIYGSRLIEPGSPFADEAPESWRRTAAISTLIANLPADCDLSPLLTVQNEYVLPAVEWIAGANTDLDWQIEKSCDPDERVRALAARLLCSRLKRDTTDKAALETLQQLKTLEEKRGIYNQLQTEHSPAAE